MASMVHGDSHPIYHVNVCHHLVSPAELRSLDNLMVLSGHSADR